MFGWPAHTGRPAVATAAECCYACADTPGCNVWNFCPRKGGCGIGCTAAKFGPTGTQEQAQASYVSLPLPLQAPASISVVVNMRTLGPLLHMLQQQDTVQSRK